MSLKSVMSFSAARYKQKKKQPIGLFFLLSGYETDERSDSRSFGFRGIQVQMFKSLSSAGSVTVRL